MSHHGGGDLPVAGRIEGGHRHGERRLGGSGVGVLVEAAEVGTHQVLVPAGRGKQPTSARQDKRDASGIAQTATTTKMPRIKKSVLHSVS